MGNSAVQAPSISLIPFDLVLIRNLFAISTLRLRAVSSDRPICLFLLTNILADSQLPSGLFHCLRFTHHLLLRILHVLRGPDDSQSRLVARLLPLQSPCDDCVWLVPLSYFQSSSCCAYVLLFSPSALPAFLGGFFFFFFLLPVFFPKLFFFVFPVKKKEKKRNKKAMDSQPS